MHILFISSLDDIQSPSKPLQTQQQIQFGISYISSLLKKHGHRTRLIIASKIAGRRNEDIINKYIRAFQPELVCFTAIATEYPFIAGIAKYIKSRYEDIYLLIGGPHASLNPEEVILGDFDALCVGEGENPALELVSQLEKGVTPSRIPNLWIKRVSDIEKNATRPFLEDIDSLPFPDREMWREWIEETHGLISSVLLGRGCPFQCSYCCNHALQKMAEGTYVRYRSPNNIIKEIKEIVTAFPDTKEIYLEVETIAVKKEWSLNLCVELERFNAELRKPVFFGANVRITPNADMGELFAAFKRCNFRFINIGLESGSERVRREILKRNYSNDDVINTVRLAREHGLKIHLYNIIGIPGETMADFKETVRVNRECLPDRHLTSIFFPYPGTDLYSLCKKQGLLEGPSDRRMERKKAVLDLPGFSKREIQKSYILFDHYVYKGVKPVYKILSRVLRAGLESCYYLNYLYRRLTGLPFLKRLKNTLKDY